MDQPEWQEYIMSQFAPNELVNGLPLAKGLVRAVRKHLGPIIEGRSRIVQAPTTANDRTATAEYTIVINRKYNLGDDYEPYIQTFTDSADAFADNITGKDFKVFATTIASTRAMARACRHALGLFVVAAEEMPAAILESNGFGGSITENQITKIDIKCSQLDVDVMKFLNQFRGSRKAPKYDSIEEVSFDSARVAFELLNKYQQNVEPIPPTIVGYRADWRNNVN